MDWIFNTEKKLFILCNEILFNDSKDYMELVFGDIESYYSFNMDLLITLVKKRYNLLNEEVRKIDINNDKNMISIYFNSDDIVQLKCTKSTLEIGYIKKEKYSKKVL